MTLKNKHVVITGAAGGLGRALCAEFKQAGAHISAVDLNQDRLDQLVQEFHPCVRGYVLDITRQSDCQVRFSEILRIGGDVDILLNNAGITHLSTAMNTKVGVIEQVMRVNFLGAVNCTQSCLPSIIKADGQVVVLSSVAGFAPLYGRAGYAASKFALHGYFETLRAELAETGVNVLLVCPSFIDSQRDNKNDNSPFPGTERPGKAKHVVGDKMSPEKAARLIIHSILKRKRLLLVGGIARQSYWAGRFFPRLYEKIMIRKTRAEVESGFH